MSDKATRKRKAEDNNDSNNQLDEKALKKAKLRAELAAKMNKLKKMKQETPTTGQQQQQQEKQQPQAPVGVSRLTGPRALLVDELGRQVDERGNVVAIDRSSTATTLVNQRRNKEKTVKKAAVVAGGRNALRLEEREKQSLEDKSFCDPRMDVPSAGRKARPTFSFVKAGKYARKADNMRHRQVMRELGLDKKLAQEALEEEGGGDAQDTQNQDINPNLIALNTVNPLRDRQEVQTVEWWDKRILPKQMRENYEGACHKQNKQDKPRFNLKDKVITIYVEHPVALPPPGDGKPVKQMPVMLTKNEQKKLRRRTRAEALKQSQELEKLGLKDAAAPKVKLSNMMRVLGQEAIKDPTKIEAEVRRQVQARQIKHEEQNRERMLSPEARKAKKEKKLLGDKDPEQTHVAVFKITDLSDPQHRFKVDINANQNRLSGVALISSGLAVVIVEGRERPVNRYKHLMLNRIKWTERCAPRSEEEAQKRDELGEESVWDNSCWLVWQGTVKKGSFRDFRVEKFDKRAFLRGFLEKKGVPHYYQMCTTFRPVTEEC